MKEFKRKLIIKSERPETPEDNLPFGGNCVIVEYRDWYNLYWKIRRGFKSFILNKKHRPTEEDKIKFKEEYGFDLDCGWIVQERNWVKWYRNHINPHFNEYED